MRVKWIGKTINLNNEEKRSPKKVFYCNWNNYDITVSLEEWIKRNYKRNEYTAYCHAPDGGALVCGAAYPSIHEAVQGCFDNIDYPLVKISECDDDQDENDI
jgi:hypothetical protein